MLRLINAVKKNDDSFPSRHPGGVVTAGLAIYDTMQYILNPISTWCVGQAASMGSLLLAAGTSGMRHSLPNARIMVHQPSGGARVRCSPQVLLYKLEIRQGKLSCQVCERHFFH